MPERAAEHRSLRVVPRSVWGAVEARTVDRLLSPADEFIVHHTAMWSCWKQTQSIDQLTYIQHLHVHQRQFHDIGYNFMVDQAGVVYEGRGWGVVGAHAKTHNINSVGVAFMGNFNDETPSTAALTAVRALFRYGMKEGFLSPDCVILGHRDVSDTECPGENLYSVLHTLRLK